MGRDPKKDRPGRPTKLDDDTVRVAEVALSLGSTFDDAARVAGVHPSTLYRWMGRDPFLSDVLHHASRIGWRRRREPYRRRPSVEWRRDCPECGAPVEVASAWRGAFRFWRCSKWRRCGWVSWRPPAPGQCPRCGGALYWSHSRKSVGCQVCGYRSFASD